MKILTVGDVFSRVGRDTVYRELERRRSDVDMVIANGENAAHGNGLSKSCFDELISAGVDVITLGNHAWGCGEIVKIMEYNENVIRPLNYEGNCPGRGSCIFKTQAGITVGVINLIGRTFLAPAASPFEMAVKETEKIGKMAKVIIVDFHAEATSEKQA